MASFPDPLPYDPGIAQLLLADPSGGTLLIWADWLEEHAPPYADAVRALARTSFRPFYSRVVNRVYWGLRSSTNQRELPRSMWEEIAVQCGLEKHGAVSSLFGVEVKRQGPLCFQGPPDRAYMAALLAAALALHGSTARDPGD